jgi:hypothetical protein
MRRVAIKSRVRAAAGILSTLLAIGWCAPMTVDASCGDYLIRPSPNGPTVPHDAPRSAPDDFGMPDHGIPTGVWRPFTASSPKLSPHDVWLPRPCHRCPHNPVSPDERPCHGPWCSGIPSPMIPLPTSVERPYQQWAFAGSAPSPGESGPIPHAFLCKQANRVHHVFPVYHPPRSA